MNDPPRETLFERRYGITPEEARLDQKVEFFGFELDERMHIARGLQMAASDAPDASPLAIAFAARINPDTVRFGSALQQMMAGDLAVFYTKGGLLELKQTLPRDGEASANAHFLQTLIFATIKELNFWSIHRFQPYRFLYERLVGTEIRPFLPAAFLASVNLPRGEAEWARNATATVELWDGQDSRPPPLFFPFGYLP